MTHDNLADEFLETKVRPVVAVGRRKVYGNPPENFALISRLWNVYWNARVSNGAECMEPEDVAVMNILQKVARLARTLKHEDSVVDVAGYAAAMYETMNTKLDEHLPKQTEYVEEARGFGSEDE